MVSRIRVRVVALALAAALGVSGVGLGAAAAAPGGKTAKQAEPYVVTGGPIFNNPLGTPRDKYRITDQIETAIRNTPKNGEIRIMSWNVMSASGVNALLDAQRRGVRVRVLMDVINLEEVPNPTFLRLQKGLKGGNKGVVRERRSKAKVCDGSCRGDGGQAHAKYYLFSRVGKTKHVLLSGSANLTTAAGVNQWNDLYKFVDDQPLFDFVGTVFEQAWKDETAAEPYVSYSDDRVQFFFSPYYGPQFVADPIQQLLDAIQCTGATDGAGNAQGRTIVRVAPDVMRNPRGLRASTRLKALWDAGCDVRIGYTVLGFDSYKVLRDKSGRGPVPMRHLVQDLDRDGEFDNYFHLKTIAVNGVVGTDTAAYYVTTGSANLSGASSMSDENVAILRKRGATLKYQKYIDHWFDTFSR